MGVNKCACAFTAYKNQFTAAILESSVVTSHLVMTHSKFCYLVKLTTLLTLLRCSAGL